MIQRETAKQNLLMLIDHCVKHGAIFNDAASVAVMVDSVHSLDAEGEMQMRMVGKLPIKSASEQLSDRINNS